MKQQHRNHFGRILLFVLVVLLISVSPVVFAQEAIALNENKLGEVSAETPAQDYQFQADAPQEVTIELLGVTSSFVPQFQVTNESGQIVATNANPGGDSSIESFVTFSSAGVYTIRVQGAGGSQGQFVLSIKEGGAPPPPPIPLQVNQLAQGTVDSNNSLQRYSFNSSPTSVLSLELQSLLPNGFPEMTLEDAFSGNVLALIGSDLLGASLQIPPGSFSYILSVKHSGPNPQEVYTILLQDAQGESSSVLTPQPTVTPQPTAQPGFVLTPLPNTGACVISPEGESDVNVRSGPATEFSIVTSITPNSVYPVVGTLDDQSWWQINVGGIVGWVAGFVVRLGGDQCGSVPVVESPPLPLDPNGDADGDGVVNSADECPSEPGTVNGCPDNDADAIPDKDDDCPDVGGPASNNGCPEGVTPPPTPEPTAVPTVDPNLDSDGDGVVDVNDDCPLVSGPAFNNGCPLIVVPIDTDGDGVPDVDDACPTEQGPASNNGCPLVIIPLDSDSDGVPDFSDDCPNSPGPASNNGCPIILLTPQIVLTPICIPNVNC